MIFRTERLIVRKLFLSDLKLFHKMQSNVNVMKFADGDIKTFEEHSVELQELINKYELPNNNFWIYAIEQKKDQKFIGTVALVKDNLDDEIGYRFLEKYWNLGFGSEICKGLISYCKHLKKTEVIAYVVDENLASAKVLEKNNFVIVNKLKNDKNQAETKYRLNL